MNHFRHPAKPMPGTSELSGIEVTTATSGPNFWADSQATPSVL